MKPTVTDREAKKVEALAASYDLIAELFVYPEDVDRERVVREAEHDVLPEMDSHVDGDAAELVASFLDDYREIEPERYVETLELSPPCPLYLGDYVFEEPETCRDMSDADRSQYMVELNGIYEHFGFGIDDELPDYLPAMVEFLRLSLPQRDEELRDDYMTRMASMVPRMVEEFENEGTPYAKLIAAFERVLHHDIEVHADVDPDEIDGMEAVEKEERTKGAVADTGDGATEEEAGGWS